MKKLVLLFAALLIGTGSSLAATAEDKVDMRSPFRFGNSFIFVENGVTFSVYPDGEFDFYIDSYAGVRGGVAVGNVGITFNSGFNYNPYVQYDDYGAVIQVENVPVFYDTFGRVNRIGNVNLWYRNGLAYRIGGMRIFYNRRGFYNYHTGFINPFNRVYVYRPFHRFFARPALGFCMVYNRPYRRFYNPVRYTYYRPYRFNRRRAFARVGNTHRYRPRAERSRIYRNDRRVAQRRSDLRRSDRIAYRQNDRSATARRSGVRSNDRVAYNENQGRRVSPAARNSGRRTEASSRQGQVVRSRQADRSSRSAPNRRSTARSSREVQQSPKGRSVQTRRSAVGKAPARATRSSNRTAVRPGGSERSAVRKAPARANRTTARSSGRSSSVKRSARVDRSSRGKTVRRASTARQKSGATSRNSSRNRSNRSGRN